VIYLDNHSTTQVDKKVLKKMLPYFSDKFYNPHSINTKYNQDIINDIELARSNIAKLIGADTQDVVFTSGATEANNMAIKGLELKIKRGKNHFITLNTEHKCVLEAMRRVELDGGQLSILKVNKDGLIDPEIIEKNIKNNTVLVSIMFANNETGVIQPIKKIAQICKEKKVLFHSDAAQAIGKIKINVKDMGIDLMSMSAHKFYGPKGIGALYIRGFPRIRLSPLIDGGGQEISLRSGTLPVPLCVGFGEAAKIAKKSLQKEAKTTKELRDYFIISLKKKIDNIIINGDLKNRLPANINFSIPNIKAKEIIQSLKYTIISSGSACTSNSVDPSYVLSGMGLKKDVVESSLRVGIGRFSTKADIDKAVQDIYQTVKLQRK
jgi:cysteine desulfurase